jgi:hypothetical protein
MTPYLELPVAIGYEGHEDKTVIGKFQPSQITHYHEGFRDVGIFIYIGGSPIQIALSIKEYEAQIVAYWNKVYTDANKRIEKSSVKQRLGIRN